MNHKLIIIPRIIQITVQTIIQIIITIMSNTIKMIKKTDMVFLNGLMEKNIEVNGPKASKMKKVKYMTQLRINGVQESGIWERK